MVPAAIAILLPTVSYATSGEPASRAIVALSKASGTPLAVAPEVAGDVLVIDVTGVELEPLKVKIAQVTGSVWETRSGVQTLCRPASLASQQLQEDRSTRKKELAEAISQVPKPGPWTLDSAVQLIVQTSNIARRLDPRGYITHEHDRARKELWEALQGAPAHRTLVRLLPHLDLDAIASMNPDERLVFSTDPTRMQRKLPTEAKTILKIFNEEQALLKKAQEGRDTFATYRADDNRQSVLNGDPNAARALLIVEDFGNSLPGIELKLFDADGKLLTKSTRGLELPKQALQENEPGTVELPKSGLDWKLALDLLSWIADYYRDQSREDALRDWRGVLIDPTEHEPLAQLAGKALISAAKLERKNLVGSLPDYALNWEVEGAERVSATQFWQNVARDWRCSLIREGDFLLVAPKRQTEARRDRLDRSSLAHFARRISGKGLVGIDDVATYTGSSRSALVCLSIDQSYTGLAGRRTQGIYDSSEQLMGWLNRGWMRLLGFLSPAQRQAILAGGEIPVNQLSPAARAALHRFVYGPAGFGYGIRSAEDPESEQTGSDDSTDLLPDGLPGSTVIRSRASLEPVLVAQHRVNEKTVFNTSFTAEYFGSSLARSRAPESILLTEGRDVQVTIDFGNGKFMQAMLREMLPGAGKLINSVDELSPELRRRVQTGLDRERERLRNQAEQERKAGAPPPGP